MNIYIEVEIRSRELERAFLLGTLASARGHTVLLGRLKGRLSNGKIPVSPGIYHAKSIGPHPSIHSLLTGLNNRGFSVTVQDEEHGLIPPDYQPFVLRRFSENSLASVEKVFCWGTHDRDAICGTFPNHAHKAVATGSPRVDFWRTEHAPFYHSASSTIVEPRRPLILLVSNIGGPLGVNDLATVARSKKPPAQSHQSAVAAELARRQSVKSLLLSWFVEAVDALAGSFPEAMIVVRPHPVERWGAWNDLVGLRTNVRVTRELSLGHWIRSASVVIQNGCTSAFEAAVCGQPLISFTPDGLGADLPPNQLGCASTSVEELIPLVSRAIDGLLEEAGRREDERELLRHRFASLEGPLAAERIVDHWEGLEDPRFNNPWSSFRVGALARGRSIARNLVGIDRRGEPSGVGSPHASSWSSVHGELSRNQFITQQKFPKLNHRSLLEMTLGLSRIGVPVDKVRFRLLGDDMVRIDPLP